MRECPVCGESSNLWDYDSGWVEGEDFQINPVSCQCQFCGFMAQQTSTNGNGDLMEDAEKYKIALKEKLDIDIIESEVDYWTDLKNKFPELTKRLKDTP